MNIREPDDSDDRFSLLVGGPFHTVLRRLGLLGADQLPTWQAAISVALFAWLPLALLAVAQSLVDDRFPGWGFFTDWTVHARYLVAIGVMIATERYADGRLAILAREFRQAQPPDDGLPAFAAALPLPIVVPARRLRRGSSSPRPWPSGCRPYAVKLAGSSWEGTVVTGEVVLSWAGEVARFVSNPVFAFLVLRWLWRFFVWTVLLYRISRLPLQLAPLHPDRSAGLGFLSIYPGVFKGFVFALSCVFASTMLKDLAVERHSSETVWIALAIWVAVVLVLFLGPLLVFVAPLLALREKALLEYGRLANQHHLAFHRKWIGEARSGEEMMGSPDASSASDLNATVQAVRELRFVPVDVAAVIQLAFAAGIPLLAVVATQMPLMDLAKWIVGIIL